MTDTEAELKKQRRLDKRLSEGIHESENKLEGIRSLLFYTTNEYKVPAQMEAEEIEILVNVINSDLDHTVNDIMFLRSKLKQKYTTIPKHGLPRIMPAVEGSPVIDLQEE